MSSQLTCNTMYYSPLVFLGLATTVCAFTLNRQGLDRYRYDISDEQVDNRQDLQENEVWYWRSQAEQTLRQKLKIKQIEGVAKNVIFFLGDGLSMTTITAARIYLGQLNNRSGEDTKLSFEQFPFTGLAKTYCVDKQVADSACSSTAYLGGVKANYATLGVTATVPKDNCSLSQDPRYHVDTVLDWAQEAGKGTGLVTTTSITHASPAGHYAHISYREWESDYDMLTQKITTDPKNCQDIASQLVHNAPGKNCNVLLGGGRKKFLPANPINPSWGEGERRDERNLVMDWHRDKAYRGKAQYVSNRKQLLDVDIKHTDYLLGLFQPYHMLYHLEEGNNEQPTLTEMTEVAIRMLQKNKRGYYLFVEGGKIDQAHHKNYARMALDETVEFHKAIQRALEMVDEKDTLVVVTADHSHTLNMVGYPLRGDDILGGDLISNQDNLPYTTLSYANGPSAEINRTGLRRNISNDNLQDIYYQYPSMVNRDKETHGGEDVAVFARGPWAHLLTGNFEQNFIPHVMQFAARIAPTRKLTAASSCGTKQAPIGSAYGSLPVLASTLITVLYYISSYRFFRVQFFVENSMMYQYIA
ncbi:alkaline phosphatase, tissue-nonspecific isozyme-like [Homalodisca vitripennis]|uniref:alkaline phosphatase, tissue-nonspecific isozyme-like n=1 Tax=Homalodisca vitripennis TaxID=197043 RepID=UPI001EEB727C|nr:alkaline phosphatase, tissue-nonspecific isozyme-like [Homalodisca vitripennis]